MSKEYKIIISIIIKSLIAISVIIGVLLSYFKGHINGLSCLLYFTIQSNIWIAIIDIIFIILLIKLLTKDNYLIHPKFYLVHQVFTVAITLTGLVYCIILVPAFYLANGQESGINPFSLQAILLHMVVPTLAIVDFILFTRQTIFTNKESLWAIIPPSYYLIFSLIGYFSNWNFGDGHNYPYFFLNYNSPAGIFGFSNVSPYYMGSFYWMIILVLIVIGISFLLIKIINHLTFKELKNK